MLIVVAILAVLMSIVFRITSLGDEESRRTETVVRMQKIENCLSGYYAAFGSYPPVKVHGYRDIRFEVDANGDQVEGAGGDMNKEQGGEGLVWAQVEAACRSQPFGCEYPGDAGDNKIIEDWASELKERVGNATDYPNYAKSAFAPVFQQGFTGPNPDEGFNSEWDNPEWKTVKLFKFGMMSFLLPRYLFMMGGDGQFFGTRGRNACAQWTDNNDMPCDPFEGESFDETEGGNGWDTIRDYAQTDSDGSKRNLGQLARIANIPSQAVCARWMPNLEHTCVALKTTTFFGVTINIPGTTGLWLDDENPPNPNTHSPPGNKGVYYKNATITIYDGWGREFYYYSPSPFQSYVVWSAGANGKTFPPWMSIDELNSKEKETALNWKSDDIMQMSH